MINALFVAKVLGPLFVIAGLGMMLRRSFFLKVIKDYCKNAALMFFTGVSSFVFGMIIVLLHNVWVASWTVLITLFGWMALIKGAWIIFFPDSVSTIMNAYVRNENLMKLHSAVAVVLGVIVTVLGYHVG